MESPSPTRPRKLPPLETGFSPDIAITSVLSVIASDRSATTTDSANESLTHVELRQSNSSSRDSSLVGNSGQQKEGISRSKSQFFPSNSRGILRSSSYSSLTLPPSPSITFAPLPATDGRKRKLSGHLGVAARSRLLQQRRAMRIQSEDDSPPKHIWRDPEVEDEDDPLITFGQFVKDASKGLWKRVSLRDIRALKDKTVSDSLVEVPHAEENAGEHRFVVDMDRGQKHTQNNATVVWEENADVVRTMRHDSAAPRVQQQA